MSLPATLENKTVPFLPAVCYYVSGVITAEEEEHILNQIHKLPATRWTTLSHRRLLSLPSQLTGSRHDTLLAAPLPRFLDDPILSRFEALKVFSGSPHASPNHVLVNEYEPGQGIMPHEDGPAYFPTTATISLGGHTVLNIYKKNEGGEREQEPSWRILQEPRSLLITTGNMYRETLHSIAEVEVDEDLRADQIVNWGLLGDTTRYQNGSANRTTRVSLTYRDVLKVANLGGAMKFMSKR